MDMIEKFVSQAPQGTMWAVHARTVLNEFENFLEAESQKEQKDLYAAFLVKAKAVGVHKAFQELKNPYFKTLMSRFASDLKDAGIIDERQASEAFMWLTRDGIMPEEKEEETELQESNA